MTTWNAPIPQTFAHSRHEGGSRRRENVNHHCLRLLGSHSLCRGHGYEFLPISGTCCGRLSRVAGRLRILDEVEHAVSPGRVIGPSHTGRAFRGGSGCASFRQRIASFRQRIGGGRQRIGDAPQCSGDAPQCSGGCAATCQCIRGCDGFGVLPFAGPARAQATAAGPLVGLPGPER